MAKTSGGVRKENGISKTLKASESSIRRNKYESAIVIGKNGNILLNKNGGKRSVSFTKEEAAKLKDAVFTHNHPSALRASGIMRIGNSFSADDLVTAVKTDVKEMRAVTPTYTFSMKRPKGGWGASPKQVRSAFMRIKSKVVSKNY